MSDQLYRLWMIASVWTGDVLFGWLLYLPRDGALLALASFSAALMLLVRRFASDQRALGWMQQDSRQLVRLLRAARRGGRREAAQRYRGTRSRVAWMRIRAEARAALITLLPLAVLLSWGAARLRYLPPAVNERFELVVYTPASAVGEVTHLVPMDGLRAERGWVRRLEIGQQDGSPRGRAAWAIRVQEPVALRLTVRVGDRSVVHPVRVGQRRYGPSRLAHGGDVESVVGLPEYRPLGVVPGLAGLAPWLVGYVALLVAGFWAGKRLWGIR